MTKVKWSHKRITISLGRKRKTGERQINAETCRGLAVHEDGGWYGIPYVITHIQSGMNFGERFQFQHRHEAKRTAERLLRLTNWKVLTMRKWKANKALRKQVLAVVSKKP